MISSILSTGTELLFGQVVNTNTSYLTKELNTIGHDVFYHFTVGDNLNRMKEILLYALGKSDIVIITGGLGPTQDDITRDLVSDIMDEELILDNDSLIHIEKFFSKINKVMTENNIRQAYLPKNSIILDNEIGTAPGFIVEKNGKIIVCLPGPPKEMIHMFKYKALDFLKSKTESIIYWKLLRFFGIGESSLENELMDLIIKQTDPTIATYVKDGEVMVRVTSKKKTTEEAKILVDDMCAQIKKRLGEYLYSEDDEELVSVVVKALIENNISLSSCESCTGGLFAAAVTDIPGASAIFNRGIVAYCDDAKISELNVDPKIIEKFGAVSFETAKAMVIGLENKTGSRICISVTGIAGPTGGSIEKPVGLVYISLIFDGELLCEEFKLRSNARQWIRGYTVLLMFNMIFKLLRDKNLLSEMTK
jgi:nicotinamide-nucleotide amidase